jgi:hypothetical protein
VDTGSAISEEDLIAKVTAVMSRFPNGANGKQIADAIGLYGVTSESISNLYKKENQTVLRKTGKGLQTLYFLATASDLEAINKAKAEEAAAKIMTKGAANVLAAAAAA